MYQLSVDFNKCDDCGTCETLLPRFRSIYGGRLRIDETNVTEEEIMAAAKRAKVACPNEAINFKVKV